MHRPCQQYGNKRLRHNLDPKTLKGRRTQEKRLENKTSEARNKDNSRETLRQRSWVLLMATACRCLARIYASKHAYH